MFMLGLLMKSTAASIMNYIDNKKNQQDFNQSKLRIESRRKQFTQYSKYK